MIGREVPRGIVAVLAVLTLAWTGAGQAQESGSWQDLKRESQRAKIDEMAKETLSTVLTSNDKAKELYSKAYGWAAFDNLKIALGFSGGGGNGVAVEKESGKRTYMQVGTVGVGLGIGGKKYQVVFLFQDRQTFSSFVEKGWQADVSAGAVAGTAGAEVQSGFVNGMAIYVVTDKGLMASADVGGTKYWKNKKLNE